GTPDYTISWTGPNGFTSTDKDLSGLEPGTYNVTVTDANGCEATNSFEVGTTDVVITITETVVDATCVAENGSISVTASGGTEPYTYLWSNGATTQSITDLAAGSYTVTVTDANGCTAEGTYTVGTEEVTITIAETVVDATCVAENGSISRSEERRVGTVSNLRWTGETNKSKRDVDA